MTPAHRTISVRHRGKAKALRHEMTDAERKLWAMLRGHRLVQLSFRRQCPIGPFIVDFVCHQHRLVVEVDGGQHASMAKDARRDEWLKANGYRVLRFWNSDVLQNRDGVLQTIVDAVAFRSPPSLTLPLKGGGKKKNGGAE